MWGFGNCQKSANSFIDLRKIIFSFVHKLIHSTGREKVSEEKRCQEPLIDFSLGFPL